MASIDFGNLLSEMSRAAAAAAGHGWPKVRDSVMPQFEELARIAVQIEQDHAAGKLNEDDACTLVKMQSNTLVAVTAGMKGQLKLVAEAAVNAAIGVLRAAVNGAIGVRLL